jgi:hypothetical protein
VTYAERAALEVPEPEEDWNWFQVILTDAAMSAIGNHGYSTKPAPNGTAFEVVLSDTWTFYVRYTGENWKIEFRDPTLKARYMNCERAHSQRRRSWWNEREAYYAERANYMQERTQRGHVPFPELPDLTDDLYQ